MVLSCFVFFSGAIFTVRPVQLTLPLTTSLASLRSALILKHWFGEVRLRFLGFFCFIFPCPQKEAFF